MGVAIRADRARHSAVTAASRRVRWAAFLAVVSATAVGVAAVAFVAVAVAVDAGWNRIIPAVLIASVVLATLIYAGLAVRKASVAAPLGIALQETEAPGLFALMRETASGLGVRSPSGVLVFPGVDAWLSFVGGQPVLVVGAPLLWGTRTCELARLIGPEVALMRFVDDPQIRRAFELMSKVRSARVADTTTPGLGGLFRRLVRALNHRVEALGVACRAAADQHVETVGLSASEADLAEAGVVEEAWDLFLHKWAVPAWNRDQAPRHLMQGFSSYLAALESSESIQRPGPRADSESSVTLLTSPQDLDEQVSGFLGEHVLGPDQSVLQWADYLELVAEPLQREQAAAVFAAVSRACGRPVPATLDALAGVFEAGWGTAVVAQLQADSEQGTAESAAPVLDEHLPAVVTTAAFDCGAGFRALDWIAGPVLVSTAGDRLPTEEWAHGLAHPEGWASVREEMIKCGLSVNQPLWLSGSEPRQRGYPDAVLIAWQRWRGMLLVFTDTGLLLLHDSELSNPRSGLRNLRGGNLLADRQAAVLQTPIAELGSTYQVRAQIAFADIVSARLKSKRSGNRWRCELRTPSGSIKISGGGSGLDFSQLLAAEIGDRLRVRGPVANDAADPTGRAFVARWMGLYPGALFLAAAAFMALSLAGTPHAAVVESCTSEQDEYGTIEYTCQASVAVSDGVEQTTLHPLRAVPRGTPIEVRVTTLPFGGHVIAQPYETKHMLWPALAMGGVMVGGGAPFVLARRRRRNALNRHARQPV